MSSELESEKSSRGRKAWDSPREAPRITEKKMPILPRAQPFAVASWVEVPE